jgi:CRISPR-associated protein Csc1
MFITVCHLTLHDYLFYASREMGRLYETEKYLHNYGLTYALGLAKSPYTNLAQVPRYSEDLDGMNKQGVYVTPAHPLRYTFSFSTFKMANVNYYNFTPQISSNQVVFGRSKELAPESTFEFFVLSDKEVALPHWVRLGKWMSKARVDIKTQGVARTRQGTFRADGALNPLDLSLLPENCNIVAMAPASLITNVFCTGSYYEVDYDEGGHARTVRLPVEMSYRPGRNARLFA